MKEPVRYELNQNFQFVNRHPSFNRSVKILTQKCCDYNKFYSSAEERCILDEHLAVRLPRLDTSYFKLDYGFPCFRMHRCELKNWLIGNLSENGVFSFSFFDEQKKSYYDKNVSLGEYCLDVEEATLTPMLSVCKSVITGAKMTSPCPWFSIVYFVSLLLVVVVLSLYLATPELRKNEHKKCFICYVGFLLMSLVTVSIFSLLNLTGFGKNSINKYILICRTVLLYVIMATFFWLHVMCIHLWRAVTSVNFTPGQSFYAYGLYAMGVPLICSVAYYVDYSISGQARFLYRYAYGGFFSNPFTLYFSNVCIVIQIINFYLFLRVACTIWYQKRLWNRNGDGDSKKHSRHHKTMFSQLLRLSVIMGLDWINIFLLIYVNRNSNIIIFIFTYINLCPGYFIFLIFVYCDDNVISALRKRFPRTMNVCSSIKSFLESSYFTNAYCCFLIKLSGVNVFAQFSDCRFPMIRSFFCKFSLELGTTLVLWMSLGTGIMTMLSPSNNVKFTVMNPPLEFWQSMEKMQKNWLESGVYQMPNFTALTPPPPPHFPAEYPEPGAVASEFTYGVSWLNVPLGFIQILVSGLGLYGVYEENDPKYLFPFLGWCVINPVIFFLMGILSPIGSIFMSFLISILQLVIYVYFVLVVYSYYSNMKGKSKHHHKMTTFA